LSGTLRSVLPRTGRDHAAVLAVLALSTAVAVLALATARGVTPLGGGSYDTDFLTAWCLLSWLLAPVPATVGRRHPATALTQTVALVLPQFVAVTVCVARYRSSGWSDGLEGLAYLHPVLLTVLTGGLVLAARRRRPG
jgi:hypothetical protein